MYIYRPLSDEIALHQVMVTVLHLFNVRPVRRFGFLAYFGGYPFSFSSSIPLSLKVLLTPAPLLHPLQDVAYLFYTHFIPKVPVLSINIEKLAT